MVESSDEYFLQRGPGSTEETRRQLEQCLQESGITLSIAQRFREDIGFLSRNESELGRQFPDQWIAIRSFTILAAKTTHDELLKVLAGMGEKPGLVLRWSSRRMIVDPSVQLLNHP